MPIIFTSHLHAIFLIGSLCAALMILFVRIRASSKPVNAMKLMMPPIGMTTGFLMFVAPMTHIPVMWGLIAFLVGAVLFAYPLIRTSKFYLHNGLVYMKRSKAVLATLLILLVIRLALHGYVESVITIYQTGAVFFLLAYGMLAPWRIAMYLQYRKLVLNQQSDVEVL